MTQQLVLIYKQDLKYTISLHIVYFHILIRGSFLFLVITPLKNTHTYIYVCKFILE